MALTKKDIQDLIQIKNLANTSGNIEDYYKARHLEEVLPLNIFEGIYRDIAFYFPKDEIQENAIADFDIKYNGIFENHHPEEIKKLIDYEPQIEKDEENKIDFADQNKAVNLNVNQKDAWNTMLKNLEAAKTTTNSDQYKRLIESVRKVANGEDLVAKDIEEVSNNIKEYFVHKGRRGVKANAEAKLVAVEELYQFMGKGVKMPDDLAYERSEEDTKKLTVDLYKDPKKNEKETKHNTDLDAAYNRIKKAAESEKGKSITEEQYENAKESIDLHHEKLLKFGVESKRKAAELNTCLNALEDALANPNTNAPGMDLMGLIREGRDLQIIYSNAMNTEESYKKIKTEISLSAKMLINPVLNSLKQSGYYKKNPRVLDKMDSLVNGYREKVSAKDLEENGKQNNVTKKVKHEKTKNLSNDKTK